ncbi:MAG: NADH-quinone oxidoreductase subunit J [Chloroflexi bacterium]|jgi:NADH-quinone oxidoreductase subunit J|nr:MAG: NADH-quinone oxidoreductase subunit J [Chloroflexota bacterium]
METDTAFIIDVVFWIIAVCTIFSAIAVVFLRDVFRSALFLVVTFIGVAGMFLLLRAEFLAMVQILLYVGAIAVLILFAVVLTRDVEQGSPFNGYIAPALVISGLILAGVIFVIINTDWNMTSGEIGSEELTFAFSETNIVGNIAELLIKKYVLAFEAVSIVLLGAVIGALAIVRRR